jgi:tRNA threonylcarbamoyladenosine biosynthesis protein TsaE
MANEKVKLTTHCREETHHLGQKIGTLIKAPVTVALIGDLGSGKTTFVQGLARGLEVAEDYYITSPTFTLVNEYPGRFRLFHVDLYRLDNDFDPDDIGLYDILASDAVVAIEWAEKLSQDLLSNHLASSFDIIDDQTRTVSLCAYGHNAVVLIKALQ